MAPLLLCAFNLPVNSDSANPSPPAQMLPRFVRPYIGTLDAYSPVPQTHGFQNLAKADSLKIDFLIDLNGNKKNELHTVFLLIQFIDAGNKPERELKFEFPGDRFKDIFDIVLDQSSTVPISFSGTNPNDNKRWTLTVVNCESNTGHKFLYFAQGDTRIKLTLDLANPQRFTQAEVTLVQDTVSDEQIFGLKPVLNTIGIGLTHQGNFFENARRIRTYPTLDQAVKLFRYTSTKAAQSAICALNLQP